MKLYHYLPKENNAREVGILTLSQKPEEIKKYGKRLGTENVEKITAWLEKTFSGRTRAISVLTEPVQTKGRDPMLKDWVATKELVSIDLNRLLADGKIESIWCKECSNANGKEEKIYRISLDKIDLSPLPWNQCSKEKGLFFGVIRHYLIVLKDGVIPAKYLKFEKNFNKTITISVIILLWIITIIFIIQYDRKTFPHNSPSTFSDWSGPIM